MLIEISLSQKFCILMSKTFCVDCTYYIWWANFSNFRQGLVWK